MESADQSHKECLNLLRPVRDALDALAGKWKLPIIVALTFGEKRFGEIANEVQGITDRMLSKELREMELNGLVKRRVYEQYPVKVTYTLTAHGQTLNEVIAALHQWGALHRRKMLAGESSDEA